MLCLLVVAYRAPPIESARYIGFTRPIHCIQPNPATVCVCTRYYVFDFNFASFKTKYDLIAGY